MFGAEELYVGSGVLDVISNERMAAPIELQEFIS